MTLKDNILEVINARGPQTDADLAKWCKAKLPSVRRTRNELVKAGELFLQMPSARGNVYGTKAATVASVVAEITKPVKIPKKGKTPSRFEVIPEDEVERPVVKDWRMTDYTF
jgi:hypothetical protein